VATVLTRSGLSLCTIPLPGKTEGLHYLEFPLEGVGVVPDTEAAISPLRVVFPPGVKVAQGFELKPQEPVATVKADATLEWNWGKDRFGIKVSTEPGGGGGQAADSGGDVGEGLALSGNLKIFAVTPMFGRMLLYGVSMDTSGGGVQHSSDIDDKVRGLIPDNVTQADIEKATGFTQLRGARDTAQAAGGTAMELADNINTPRNTTDAALTKQFSRVKELGDQAQSAATQAEGAVDTAIETASATLAKIQKSVRAVGMFLRFFLNYFHYAADAARLAAELLGDAKRRGEPKSAAETTLWVHVLAVTSALDALLYLFKDDPEYVGKALDLIELELQVEACGSVIAKGNANIDVNETVSGRCKFTLAKLLLPFMEVLLEKPEQPSDEQIAERIIPLITGTLEERFCAKVGFSVGHVELESKGPLGELSVFIPPGSPLKKKLIELAGTTRKIITDKYQRGREEQFQQAQPKWHRTAQKVLRQLDVQVKAWLVEQSAESVWKMTLSPAAEEVIAKIRETEQPDAPGDTTGGAGAGAGAGSKDGAGADGAPTGRGRLPGTSVGVLPARPTPVDQAERRDLHALSPAARAVVDLIDRTGLQGTGFAQGAPLLEVAAAAGDGAKGRVLSLLISDSEKAAVEASGWTPPRPIERARETVRLTVALPVAPRSVGWNTWTDPRGQGAMGLAAGFATDAEARLLTQRPVQAPPPPATVWDRPDGLHYAWVETRLLGHLQQQKLALPRLVLRGASLDVAFDAIPAGRLDLAAVTAALRAEASPLETTWRLVLLTGATSAEESAIRARLGQNRPRQRSPRAEEALARGRHGAAPARERRPAVTAVAGAAVLRTGPQPAASSPGKAPDGSGAPAGGQPAPSEPKPGQTPKPGSRREPEPEPELKLASSPTAPKPAPEQKPEPQLAPKPAPVPEQKPAPEPEPKLAQKLPAPAPEQKPAPKPEPGAAQKLPSKPAPRPAPGLQATPPPKPAPGAPPPAKPGPAKDDPRRGKEHPPRSGPPAAK
jgi:hypothetical protein